MDYENFSLKKHQKKTIELLQQLGKNKKDDETQKGLIAFHSVGSGKTITAITAANCLIQDGVIKRAIFLTPASAVDQTKKVLEELNIKYPNNVYIMSHDTYINGYKKLQKGKDVQNKEPYKLKQSLFIVDEVHTFKKEPRPSVGSALEATKTKASTILKAAYSAKRVLLLTATPIINTPNDIKNYLAMIEGVKDPTTIQYRYSDLEIHPEPHVKCRFTFFKKNLNSQGYPNVYYHTVKVLMNDEYLEKYKHIADNQLEELYEQLQKQEGKKHVEKAIKSFGTDTDKNLKSFLFGVRQAVNKIDYVSPKIVQAYNYITTFANKEMKVLLYSEWLTNGSYLIRNKLENNNYTYTQITGGMKTSERENAITNFNKEGPPYILLINKSGSVGLDLKGTRGVILLEPYWNEARINQVIGRAIRTNSHNHLSENEQRVDIYTFLLTRPDGVETADEFIKRIAEEKQKPIEEFEEKIKKNAANMSQNMNECKKLLQKDSTTEDEEYIPPSPPDDLRLPKI